MGSILLAFCKCGYESKRLFDGDGEHFIAICDQCQAVVNPKFIPFEFTLPPCPTCDHTVQSSEYRYQLVLFHEYKSLPVISNCPQCKTGRLMYKDIMNFSMEFDKAYPQQGKIIHGFYNGKNIEIPGMATVEYTCHLPNLETYATNKVMELEVVDIIKKETLSDEYAGISLRFIRYLSKSDLGFTS
jgi:hypothetical protein